MPIADKLSTVFEQIVNFTLADDANRVSAYQIQNGHWALSERSPTGFDLLIKKGKIRGKDTYEFIVLYSGSRLEGEVIELEATAVAYKMDNVKYDLRHELNSLLEQAAFEKAFFADSENLTKINRIEFLLKTLSRKYQWGRYPDTVVAQLYILDDVGDVVSTLGPRSPLYEIESVLQSLEADLKAIQAEKDERNRIVTAVASLSPLIISDVKKAIELKILA